MTVVLQHRIESNVAGRVANQLGSAFAHAYAWSLIGILVALVRALLLMREELRARRVAAAAGVPAPEGPPAVAAA